MTSLSECILELPEKYTQYNKIPKYINVVSAKDITRGLSKFKFMNDTDTEQGDPSKRKYTKANYTRSVNHSESARHFV